MKISCFCAKAHLVFHWCLYNKMLFKLCTRKHCSASNPDLGLIDQASSGGLQWSQLLQRYTNYPTSLSTLDASSWFPLIPPDLHVPILQHPDLNLLMVTHQYTLHLTSDKASSSSSSGSSDDDDDDDNNNSNNNNNDK